MGLEEQLRARIDETIQSLVASGGVPAAAAAGLRFNVEAPRKGGSGHLASNVALVLAKPAGRSPRDVAAAIRDLLTGAPEVEAVEVAGPGFLNVTLRQRAFSRVLGEVLEQGRHFGHAPAASKSRINVEFVSANPTGPLLISHGRGAVVGDVVARLLEVTGHRVTREYYINDFGNQVRLLARSVRASALGQEAPEGGYGGFYVAELAKSIRANAPGVLDGTDDEALSRQCVTYMLSGIPNSDLLGIRDTLARLGIEFDVWTSEEGLHRWSKVQGTLDLLDARGRLAKGEDGSVSFIAGDEDDKDRVVRKRDGATTYFASDIAYHEDKFARGFEHLVDVWGADHHGYIARLRSAIDAVGRDSSRFEVLLFQLVSLLRDGKPYRMGKRLGNLITLQEVVEEIDEAVGNLNAGRDAVRFFFLSRRADTPITLDVELAKKQESENPVFYIQYGHARLCSIQRRAAEVFGLQVPRASAALLERADHPLERALIGQLGRYPALLEEAAIARDPHKVVAFLQQIAQDFQSYYSQLRLEGDSILPRSKDMTEGWEARWDKDKTLGRLLWVDAIRSVYSSGLGLLGLEAPERMARQVREDEPDEAVEG
jgi:arginyl-tRNA synthetase